MDKPLLKRVCTLKTLNRAWSAIRKNGRLSKSEETRKEVAAFEAEVIENIGRIQRQLQSKAFKFAKAQGKKNLKKDKKNFRPLVIAPLESRIVQRAIHDVLIGLPELQLYIKTEHSFGGIKKDQEDEIAAVPAAIKCVLDAIGNGSLFVVRSDISDFFTKIPKSTVTSIIRNVVSDEEFLKLFSAAIKVELENMSRLRNDANKFPIEDIGVAQGNSLSPLLGNLYLYNFDKELNRDPDIRCIRYIDDFIILAPSKSAAANHFAKAVHILKELGLEVSKKKTIHGNAKDGFEFLGIEIENGLIRPSKESRDRLVATIKNILTESEDGFKSFSTASAFDNRFSLLTTLRRVRGTMQGWGKHYWFCNDFNSLAVLSRHIDSIVKGYFAVYAQVRKKNSDVAGWNLLGIEPLDQLDRSQSFLWPNRKPLSNKFQYPSQP
jgi:retron-type reverse transcriptase